MTDGGGGGAGPLSLADYEDSARRTLPADVWDFIAGGAGEERTVAANRAVFDTVRLRTRVLAGVEEPDLTVRVLGDIWNAPIGVAPLAYHELAHFDGETGVAKAAGELGLPVVVSTFASQTLERIAAEASAPLMLQLYVFRDWPVTEALARRAAAAGYRALVLTVDTPRLGRRLRDLRNAFRVPSHIRPVNLDAQVNGGTHHPAEHSRQTFDTRLDWSVVDRLRAVSGLPVLVKGLLTAEDAAAAVAAGADGVLVSNHGGRQLDGVPSTLEVLPEVAAAVDGRCPVFLDGGVRRGADVFAALALGARAVFVGRPAMYGLAVSGAAGVRDVLSLLVEELAETMLLTGRAAVDRIDTTAVSTGRAGGFGWDDHRPVRSKETT
ncbi:alpha-hydroxy acid oxidase [Micromonospora sp. CA-240977]|uniref:alpha-hydroxy acid oxidase n=1 Tax=Micromonospora sp. CA-240977 TaxID=3239957 RepID=UPI003D8ED2C9